MQSREIELSDFSKKTTNDPLSDTRFQHQFETTLIEFNRQNSIVDEQTFKSLIDKHFISTKAINRLVNKEGILETFLGFIEELAKLYKKPALCILLVKVMIDFLSASFKVHKLNIKGCQICVEAFQWAKEKKWSNSDAFKFSIYMMVMMIDTPCIVNAIKKSKEKSFKDSATSYLSICLPQMVSVIADECKFPPRELVTDFINHFQSKNIYPELLLLYSIYFEFCVKRGWDDIGKNSVSSLFTINAYIEVIKQNVLSTEKPNWEILQEIIKEMASSWPGAAGIAEDFVHHLQNFKTSSQGKLLRDEFKAERKYT